MGSVFSKTDETGSSFSTSNGKGSMIAKLNKKAAKKIYVPLKEGQIRLVHLHPRSSTRGRPDSQEEPTIICSLLCADLSEVPTYQALSYVWGEQVGSKKIILDGQPFYITRNLFEILNRLPLHHENRALWIDALCINQSDIPERNSQVQMMRSIYSQAQETLIWLHQKLDYLNDSLWVCLHHNDMLSLRDSDISHILRGFTRQTYWLRVWTAQEVRYSKQVTLMTRLGRVPFDILTTLQDAVLTKLKGTESQDPFGEVALEAYLYEFQKTCLAVQPRQSRNEDHLDFDDWIDLCALKDCLDPRDLVFGFWGCFPPEVQNEIQVDYSLPAEQILSTCKRAFLKTTRQLEFLARSNFASETRTRTLPSWDPELYFSGTWKQAWWAMKLLETSHLAQPSRPGPDSVAFRELSDDTKVLHVKGRWLGSIVSAARRFPTENAYGSYLLTYFVECMKILNVKEEEVEDFALAILGQRQDTTWVPELLEAFRQLAKTPAKQGELEEKIKVLAVVFRSSDRTNRFVSKVSTVVRLQNNAATLFGMTWIKEAEPGDQVCLIQGCSQPLMLRSRGTGCFGREEFKLIGAVAFPGPADKRQVVEDLFTMGPLSDVYLV